MKLHKGLVAACVETLVRIFSENRQADRMVEQTLKSNKKWGARDRSFIAEHSYEAVRWWRLAKYVAEVDHATSPAHFWRILGAWIFVKPVHLSGSDFPDTLPEWPEFEGLQTVRLTERYNEAIKVRKIAQSVPDWLDERGERELGAEWSQELAALNKPAPVTIRVNTLKATNEVVIAHLGNENVQAIADVPNAFQLLKKVNLANNEHYQQGFFEVQDAGSQLIAPYLDIRPGLSVIDACAGAGGKSLHIAALLNNTGSILSMDVTQIKLDELKRRAARNGVTNLETKLIDSDKLIGKLAGTADRLLLDVPCSGLGVLRRNPDTKWKMTPEFIENIRGLQWHILSNYSQMVKKGGKMVYATCSILRSESEDQVARFLSKNKEWRLRSEYRTSVARQGFDGFYMALLERK